MKKIEIGKVYMMGASSCAATRCFVLKKALTQGCYWVSIPNSMMPISISENDLFEVHETFETKTICRVRLRTWSSDIHPWCYDNLEDEDWEIDDMGTFNFNDVNAVIKFITVWSKNIENISFENKQCQT